MIAYHAKETEDGPTRAHPWNFVQGDLTHAYVDFKASPHLIRSSIEDLRPYQGRSFAETFFKLIEWINGSDCRFESNDCAFRGPSGNIDTQFGAPLRCDGRLMSLGVVLAPEPAIDHAEARFGEEMMRAAFASVALFTAPSDQPHLNGPV